MRIFGVVALAAALGVGGCTAVHGDRSRLVQTQSLCADQTVQIYFEPWSAELTREGRMVIDTAAANLRACRILSVEVVGLADAAGAPQANLELSRRRADAVSAALAASGLPAAHFQVAAAGQAGAVTAEGQVAPLRRRVDVTLRVTR